MQFFFGNKLYIFWIFQPQSYQIPHTIVYDANKNQPSSYPQPHTIIYDANKDQSSSYPQPHTIIYDENKSQPSSYTHPTSHGPQPLHRPQPLVKYHLIHQSYKAKKGQYNNEDYYFPPPAAAYNIPGPPYQGTIHELRRPKMGRAKFKHCKCLHFFKNYHFLCYINDTKVDNTEREFCQI